MAAMTGFTSCLIYLSCVALVQCTWGSHKTYKTGDDTVTITSRWTGRAEENEDSPMMSFLSNNSALLKEKLGIDDDGLKAELEVKPIVCLSVHLSVCAVLR